jgi:polyisoprenoid-binding protein YceI
MVALTGDLTLLGVTQPLEVDVAVKRLADGRFAFVAHARIDRLAFGMNSGFPVISRDVDLTVSSEASGG